MAQYRDWYIDRKALANRGNMTVKAVRMEKTVSCAGTAVQQIDIADQPNEVIKFSTKMARHNARGQNKYSSDSVQVRTYPALAVWADDFVFEDTYRTSATLVFAALNGSIEGGLGTFVTDKHITELSAIKCNIDIEYVDDVLRVGNGGLQVAPQVTLLSRDEIHIG